MGRLLIIGAGGHAGVVADVAQACGWTIRGFLDDARLESSIPGIRVLGKVSDAPRLLGSLEETKVVVAIGDNTTRKLVVEQLVVIGADFATLVHPASTVSPHAKIGLGTVVMAGVIVNVGAEIGEHVILNTSCSVDHDCRVSGYSHLSPGVHLSGCVSVGEGAHLGTGVVAVPGSSVGAWSVVGAGAAVIKNIPAQVVAYGVPARVERSLVKA